ncbi:MAG TPA: energy transducer TonB [Vicinamibacterales bacterium]|nr:energy transducer TonB [Vicinamibacterales bacterium]
MRYRILVPLLLAASMARPAFAQNGPAVTPLASARELYASARYDEALAVLDDLRPEAAKSAEERRAIEQYRSLCLLALGRGAEAENAIAAVVTTDPTYQPSEAEASPRVRAAFSEVRQRLLPDIARARYTAAKATFDRKDFKQAAAQFDQVIRLLDDPDMGGRLADLRTLAAGFLDLAAAAAAPPPEPEKPEPPAPAPTPRPDPNRIYVTEEDGIIAPQPIKQEVPQLPAALRTQARDRGLLEIIVDERGRVMSATVRESMHPLYDSLLLNAARDWRYRPATLNGTPVKFRKLIQINLTRN